MMCNYGVNCFGFFSIIFPASFLTQRIYHVLHKAWSARLRVRTRLPVTYLTNSIVHLHHCYRCVGEGGDLKTKNASRVSFESAQQENKKTAFTWPVEWDRNQEHIFAILFIENNENLGHNRMLCQRTTMRRYLTSIFACHFCAKFHVMNRFNNFVTHSTVAIFFRSTYIFIFCLLSPSFRFGWDFGGKFI